MRRLVAFMVFVWCGSLSVVVSAATADVNADGFWLRETIPGQPHGAGFGVLKNKSDFDLFLIGGAINAAEDVEIHQHIMEAQQMRMEQIEALMIPAQASVQLQPGGYHVMLMNLRQPLIAGEHHLLTLIFSDGTTVEVDVPVRPLLASEAHTQH